MEVLIGHIAPGRPVRRDGLAGTMGHEAMGIGETTMTHLIAEIVISVAEIVVLAAGTATLLAVAGSAV